MGNNLSQKSRYITVPESGACSDNQFEQRNTNRILRPDQIF
jgi:hypothetical protein